MNILHSMAAMVMWFWFCFSPIEEDISSVYTCCASVEEFQFTFQWWVTSAAADGIWSTVKIQRYQGSWKRGS